MRDSEQLQSALEKLTFTTSASLRGWSVFISQENPFKFAKSWLTLVLYRTRLLAEVQAQAELSGRVR